MNGRKFSPLVQDFTLETTTRCPAMIDDRYKKGPARMRPYTQISSEDMTQAEVDLKLNGDGASAELSTGRLPLPYKRKSAEDSEDDSSQDEADPSWRPCKQPKKRRRNHRPRDRRAHAALNPKHVLLNENHHDQSSAVDSDHYHNPEVSSVRVELTDDCDTAWEDFRPLGTEMIICKEGRYVVFMSHL